MDYHILIVLFLLFIMIINRKNTLIEGHSDEYDVTSNYSSRVREKVQQCRTELNSVLGLDYQTIDHILKDNILKAQLLSEIKNQNNPNIVTNSGNHNQEIIDMLTHLMEEVDQERIENYNGDKGVLRDSINARVDEEISRYGNRIEVITKSYLDRKYKELEEQYELLSSTNQCEGAETKAREEEQETCNVSIDEKKEEIDAKEKEIKELGKKIAQHELIQKQMKVLALKKKSRSSLKIKKGKYCGGRRHGRHRRHCGGRTVRKNECERTYKKFKGRMLQCQWVNSRRSCDFWQPGKPYTKKYC
jgi:hypothetical protein